MKDLFNECSKVFNTKIIFHSDNFNFKKQFLKDNFLKNKKFQFIKTNHGKSNDNRTLLKSFSNQVKKIGFILNKDKPSIIVLIGDRSETLAAAIAATQNQIPILHIHGGEVSFGSIDEKYRHCITKLSSFHLVSHSRYKKRLVQLGENNKSIRIIGSLSLDNISKKKTDDRSDFFKKYKYISKKFILVSINSSLNDKEIKKISNNMFSVLDRYKEIDKVVTYPNSDLHNYNILKDIELRKKRGDYKIFKSLGTDYVNFLKHCHFMIGNSSSGIIEAPFFNKVFFCLGNRQNGRLYSKNSTIKIFKYQNIQKDIQKFINSKKKINADNLYYKKNAISNSIKFLKKINLLNVNYKKFVDLDF